MDEMIAWLRRQSLLSLLRIFLIDAPMFVVKVWARLYLYVVAFGTLLIWATLLIWLAQAAWRNLTR